MLHADAFLAGILGRPSFRLEVPAEGPDEACLAAARGVTPPAFLFARVPTEEPGWLRRLEAEGFGIVDTNVTLERPAAPVRAPALTGIRFAAKGDRDGVMAVAGTSFRYSRLHLDPAVPREAADRSRALWAGNFFAGERGDHMVVAEQDRRITGFLQLLGPKDGVLTIDLITVAAEARRQGVAAALIAFAVAELRGLRQLRVGTQIANIQSLRLYEKLGFRIAATQYMLHCHRS